MKVVGLDLSLTSTGVATITDAGITTERITSKGMRTDTLTQRADRLSTLTYRITENVPGDALVVVEAPAFSRSNPGMHDRSGLWWLVVDVLRGWGYDLVEVAPTARAKYATGKGNAGKDEVLAAVVRRYPTVDVNGNDEADALVLAAMGARWLGFPIDDVPATHLAAMDKVAWPQDTRCQVCGGLSDDAVCSGCGGAA